MTENKKKRPQITLADVVLKFKNFSGSRNDFNAEGNRNVCVFLSEEQAEICANANLPVKTLQGKEDGDEPVPFLKVSIGYNGYSIPTVKMIKPLAKDPSKRMTNLTESTVGQLDHIEISHADLIINPADWGPIQGKSGVKAWVVSLYAEVVVDEFEEKYAHLMQGAAKCIGPDCPIDED